MADASSERIVVTKLIGGLGNQMFQYAVARRLAHVHHMRLKLDISGFKDYELRRYELDCLNILAEIASESELARFKKHASVNKWVSRLTGKPLFYSGAVIRERFFQFDPLILKLNRSVYLEGYWQSEKYFKDIEGIIRREFTIRHEPDRMNTELAAQIHGKNSIALHVRRGDYLSNPVTSKYHGTCSINYYRQAAQRIANSVSQPHFFAFSDDPEWVRENLKLGLPITYVSHNGADKNYEDLRLMSLCKHHIIANSSFSWWGAWLNGNADKIVIAPVKWFDRDEIDTSDLIPKGWIRL